MSDLKHTAGPWQWDDDEVWQEGYDTEQHAPWLVGPEGETILRGQIYCLSEADARLIAAAPELLEALRNAVEALENCQGEKLRDRFPLTLADALAAMAKATGSQS